MVIRLHERNALVAMSVATASAELPTWSIDIPQEVSAAQRRTHNWRTTALSDQGDRNPRERILGQCGESLRVVRTEGRIHFANAHRVGDKMWPMIHDAKPKVVLLDCSAVPDIEYTALRMLTDAEEKLRELGIALWLAALNPDALPVIRKAPLGKTHGRDRLFFNAEEGVSQWRVAAIPAAEGLQRGVDRVAGRPGRLGIRAA
jgi:MFS superfamily sulfate permease-like transporter